MIPDRLIPSEDENKTKGLDVFVTYDIDEKAGIDRAGGSQKAVIYQVAKKVPIRGKVISWVIGEFKIRDVELVFGVSFRYRSDGDDIEKKEIVKTSKYAQNIQIFVGRLPAAYQKALQHSA